jgi:hypothetical protein
MVKVLRETEKVDVVIALSHGGVEKGEDGRYGDGDDVRVAIAPQDLPNTFTDIAAGTPLANLCTDAFRKATKIELGDLDRGYTPIDITGKEEGSVATVAERGAVREIKEWQAIMDHLRSLPVKSAGELPTIPVDERAAEVRAIKVR